MSIRPYPVIIRPSFHFRFLSKQRCVSVCIYGTYGLISRALLPTSQKYPAINEWKAESGEWRANFQLSSHRFLLPSSYPARSGHNPAIHVNTTFSGDASPKRCRGETLRSTARTCVYPLAIYPATRREGENVRKCPQATKSRSSILDLSTCLEAIYDLWHASDAVLKLSNRKSANVRKFEWGVRGTRFLLHTSHSTLQTS